MTGFYMTDQETTIQELKDMVKKFREERGWLDTDQKDIAISVCLEAAELLEHFQWAKTEDVIDNPKWKEAVGEEISDIVFLLMEMVDRLGIDLATAFDEKRTKQAKKYPVEQFNPSLSREEQMQAYYRVKAKTRTDHPFADKDNN
jgi:dCTP diphosphatase